MFKIIADAYVTGIIPMIATKGNLQLPTYIAGTILVALIAYVLGSMNFALILSKRMFGDDIRKYGSKNAGTTNMARTYGKKAATLTIVGDIGKGIVACVIGSFIMSHALGGYVAGLFCVLGHIFPVFYGFKGGKGVATSAAVMLVTNPLVFLVILCVFLLTVLLTRYVSLGSCIGAGLYPFLTYQFVANKEVIGFRGIAFIISFLIAALVICKHHTNLKRLANGTESKFSFKKNKSTEEKSDAGNK